MPVVISASHPSPSRRIPLHVHGSSRYYYDLGCEDALCKAKAASCQAGVRTKRRAERVLIDGRMIHPRLADIDTDAPARHGTVYGRYGYGCQCAFCEDAATPRLPRLPARLADPDLEMTG